MNTNEYVTSLVTEAWEVVGCASHHIPHLDDFVEKYNQPHRAYHNMNHIRECLGWHNQITYYKGVVKPPKELALALAYHDVIYEPAKTNNEQLSSDYFRSFARGRISLRSTDMVCELIEGTSNHMSRMADFVFMIDIDLAILGASPAQYDIYAQNIRKEYSFVSDSVYTEGRSKVLQGFLDREPMYNTAWFHERLTYSAKDNVERELNSLQKL